MSTPDSPDGAERSVGNGRLDRVVSRLLDTSPAPPALWVANSPLTDAMASRHDRPARDLGDHHDWLMVAADELVLVRYQPWHVSRSAVAVRAPWTDVEISTSDHGELDRRRAIVVDFGDQSWVAFGASLSRRHRDRVERFTDHLVRRAGASGRG